MKLFGIMVAQNEEDLIEDILQFLRNLNAFEAIFFFDLGSDDNTFIKAQTFNDILYKPKKLNTIYTPKLHYDLLKEQREAFNNGDWVAVMDVDEFYADDPTELIEIAEREDATSIKISQAQFMFTDEDLENFQNEDVTLPIELRRKYYLINWSEFRFYKVLPGPEFISAAKPCSRRLLNRHYQYRTPQQIKTRIKTRLENRKKAEKLPGRARWPHIFSQDWRDYIISHKILHNYNDGEFRFGIPEGVQWKDYFFSKDPKSHILPQVAIALMKERKILEDETPFQESNDIKTHEFIESYRPGSVTFKDCYGKQVLKETINNFRRQIWGDCLIGFKVLIMFYTPILVRSTFLKFSGLIFKFRLTAAHLFSNIKRRLFGKSAGSINADPNPIEISDFSGMGETTLNWKSDGTARVEIRMNAPDGQLLGSTGNSGNMKTGKWVRNNMIFYLQDVSDGLPLSTSNTIAAVKVKLMTSRKITI